MTQFPRAPQPINFRTLGGRELRSREHRRLADSGQMTRLSINFASDLNASLLVEDPKCETCKSLLKCQTCESEICKDCQGPLQCLPCLKRRGRDCELPLNQRTNKSVGSQYSLLEIVDGYENGRQSMIEAIEKGSQIEVFPREVSEPPAFVFENAKGTPLHAFFGNNNFAVLALQEELRREASENEIDRISKNLQETQIRESELFDRFTSARTDWESEREVRVGLEKVVANLIQKTVCLFEEKVKNDLEVNAERLAVLNVFDNHKELFGKCLTRFGHKIEEISMSAVLLAWRDLLRIEKAEATADSLKDQVEKISCALRDSEASEEAAVAERMEFFRKNKLLKIKLKRAGRERVAWLLGVKGVEGGYFEAWRLGVAVAKLEQRMGASTVQDKEFPENNSPPTDDDQIILNSPHEDNSKLPVVPSVIPPQSSARVPTPPAPSWLVSSRIQQAELVRVRSELMDERNLRAKESAEALIERLARLEELENVNVDLRAAIVRAAKAEAELERLQISDKCSVPLNEPLIPANFDLPIPEKEKKEILVRFSLENRPEWKFKKLA